MREFYSCGSGGAGALGLDGDMNDYNSFMLMSAELQRGMSPMISNGGCHCIALDAKGGKTLYAWGEKENMPACVEDREDTMLSYAVSGVEEPLPLVSVTSKSTYHVQARLVESEGTITHVSGKYVRM